MFSGKTKYLMLAVALLLPFTACNDNTSGTEEMDDPSAVTAVNQGTSNGNQVVIAEVVSSVDGWVVIHRSNASNDGPQVPEIIGKAQVDAGVNTDVAIQLEESVSNEETLWAMLHEDTGVKGEYEFDGENGLDNPVVVNEMIVMTSFMITQTDPSISSPDQVKKGNIFTFDVNAAEDGWIVIHASNASNDGPQIPEIIGKAQVEAGVNTGVEVALNEGAQVATGATLYPMLHYDTGVKGEYEFDGQNGLDGPVLFDGEIVMTSFVVLENTSILTANDQTIMDNGITVDVTSDTDGWVVVHRSNESNDGPQVPEIIGMTQISAGTNTDVFIEFAGGEVVNDGEKLWPMVHYDTGAKGTYEFDGVGIHDQPVVTAEGILMTSIIVSGSTPSVTASDQSVSNNMLTLDEVNTEQIGFIVLHLDNGNNAPVVPASIGHAQVYTGVNNDVMVTLDDGVNLSAGTKVWAMLHTDTGTIGSYDFDGSEGSDDPPVTDSNDDVVMVQFTIQ